MRKWGCYMVLAGLLTACAAGPQPVERGTAAAPAAMPAARGGLVVDVRTDKEWGEGHLEGAVLIPHDRIAERIGTVAADKSSRIYLYCRTGRRTGIALDSLKKAGYTDVINLGTLENAAKTLGKPVVK